MKFVKENLVPLICGLIVLLAVGAIFWPIGSWVSDLQDQMKTEYDKIATVQAMKSPVTIPDGKTVDTIAENVIAAQKAVQTGMHDQAQKINDEAAAQNHLHRILPPAGPNSPEIPLLNNDPMANYLPKTNSRLVRPFGFKIPYGILWQIWTDHLVQASNQAIGVPVTDTEITTALQIEQARLHPVMPGQTGDNGAGANDPQLMVDMGRRLSLNRASYIHMYVDHDCFQRQPWANGSAPPNEAQMFDALVETWFQQDVVAAILATNKGTANVGAANIKRLEKITVGLNAPTVNAAYNTTNQGGASSGTPTPGPAAATGGQILGNPAATGGTPAPAGPVPGIDLTRSMTGRIGNQDYDVVYMNISVDIDPAAENKFIDALYRQNNGYTVIMVRSFTVDPLDAASKGYLYGDVQVVHLEILVEGLLFRNWTLPIMPADTKTLLGIGAPPPPAPAQNN